MSKRDHDHHGLLLVVIIGLGIWQQRRLKQVGSPMSGWEQLIAVPNATCPSARCGRSPGGPLATLLLVCSSATSCAALAYGLSLLAEPDSCIELPYSMHPRYKLTSTSRTALLLGRAQFHQHCGWPLYESGAVGWGTWLMAVQLPYCMLWTSFGLAWGEL